MSRKYWKGLEELKETPSFIERRDQEFPQPGVDVSPNFSSPKKSSTEV